MSKKEYYLKYDTAYGDVFSEEKVNPTDIRVIEYSAYEYLMNEITHQRICKDDTIFELERELESTKKVYQMNRRFVEDAKNTIRNLENQVEKLKSIISQTGGT
jgi:hypothetical protein